MIRRLTNLEIEDFRVFRGRVSVPLDADVVLIYGPNGSGKTSLISALEYAITGAVEDLQAFSDDYPRCLTHIRTSGAPRSSLYFESVSGESLCQSTSSEACPPGVKRASMSEADRRFFVERCYLSQHRLARLFELYQSTDKEQPEQPLVRFVRELLDLDLLENITTGLYEAADIRRVHKSCYSLSLLRDQEVSVPAKLSVLRQQKTDRASLWKESLNAIQGLWSATGDPSRAPDTSAGVRSCIEALESAEKGESALQALHQSQGRVESAVGLLRASRGPIAQDLSSLKGQLTAIENRKNAIEPRLSRLLERADNALQAASLPTSQITPPPDISQRLEEIEHALGESLFRLNMEIEGKKKVEDEIRSLKSRVGELQATIGNLDSTSARRSQEQQRLGRLLQGILEHLSGELCPVCGRDYSELKSGALKSRIAQELERIGLDTERLESAAKRRSELEAERDALLPKIAAMEERAKGQPRFDLIVANRDELAKLLDDLRAENDPRAEWARLRQEEGRIQAEIRTFEMRLSQQEKSTLQISQLADELEISSDSRPSDAQALADSISTRVRTQIDELERRRRARNELLTALARAERTARELEDFDKQIDALSKKQQGIQSALAQVEQCLEKARSLARAANSAKQRLLREVFNDRLNALWEDLFQRLVKLETFFPRLSEPTVKRGQIRAAIQAIAKGADLFEEAGSVLSQANLNTAALSLFLSLHLVERTRHHVIVLDDPIQSMDDVRVAQLANLLRAIVREARRQLVLCVHERSLYEYLCLELGPTRESDSLLAIELVRNPEGDGSIVRPERRTWKPDLVTFGA